MSARDRVIELSELNEGRSKYGEFTAALDALVNETLADAADYLTRHGYADSAYLLRTCDVSAG